MLLCGCLGCNDSPSTVKWTKPLNYLSDELFPITIGKYGYPYIEVKINSEGFDLVWDTGNMSGLTLSTELAERLNLPILGESKSYDSAGDLVGEYRTFNVGELDFFNTTRKDIRAYEFSHSDLEGLVGPGFIVDGRFTIDYKNKIIAISSSPLPTESVDTTLSMVRSPKYPALILVYGFVNNQKVLIEIDTGKSRTVIDPELAESLELPETSNGYR
jgi:predicted aspartyl protease